MNNKFMWFSSSLSLFSTTLCWRTMPTLWTGWQGYINIYIKGMCDLHTIIKRIMATSWEELTHWKRLWCWEGLGAGGEGDDRGWDGWVASLTWWTWVWVNSGSWWWTGRPGVLQFMLQRVGHDWVTELNWTELMKTTFCILGPLSG